MKKITLEEGAPQKGLSLIYVATEWCPYCLKTKPVLQRAEEARPDIQFMMIDGDDEPDALPAFSARTYPTLVLLRDGEEIARRPSVTEDAEFSTWLDEALAA